MAVRVLVVDDSRFFRRRLAEILNADPQIEVIGSAENGAEAVTLAATLKPDVITMDVEMPVMDGISAVRRIMAESPTSILMFSSLTTEGAQSTLDALDAGAVDFLPKRFEDIARDREEANRQLRNRVRQIARRMPAVVGRGALGRPTRPETLSRPVSPGIAREGASAASPAAKTAGRASKAGDLRQYNILAIGTSTGGPVALQEVLTRLPKDFPLPIVLVQHMPGTFTTAFASRLDKLCKVRVKEAEDGDVVEPGRALLAPGGKQLLLQRQGSRVIARVHMATPGQTYKPCVDLTFNSVADVYHGKVLAIVLTGMGADGREGVRKIKKEQGACWVQDAHTCVVFGMPGSVVEAGLADRVLPLTEIGPQLVQGI